MEIMFNGALGNPQVYRVAAVILVLELSLVFLLIACDYKTFNFSFEIREVDQSQSPDIEMMWLDASNAVNSQGILSMVNRSSTRIKPAPLHLSSGILSSRVIMLPAFQERVRESWERAVQWTVNMNTVDSVVLIYLFLSVSYAGLFINTSHLLNQNENAEDVLEKPAIEETRGDVNALDAFFFIMRFCFIFAVQKLCNFVVFDAFVIWTSFIYVVFMVILCEKNKQYKRVVVAAGIAWNIHFVMILVSSGMSILSGLAFVTAHMCSMVNVFIHVIEPPITIGKFMNARYWDHVVSSSLLFLIYTSRLIFVPNFRTSFVAG